MPACASLLHQELVTTYVLPQDALVAAVPAWYSRLANYGSHLQKTEQQRDTSAHATQLIWLCGPSTGMQDGPQD